jgi:hypothetical protein
MPQECSVCRHPDRADIDRRLIEKQPLRNVAEHSGTSVTALHRHKAHLAVALTKAAGAREAADATTLLQRVEELIQSCKGIAERANRAKQWQSATSALRECRCNLALLAELSGQLQSGGGVKVGIGVTVNAAGGGEISSSEATKQILAMCGEPRLRDWLKDCLSRAGDRSIYFPLEAMEPETMVKQLSASKELREKTRGALIEADLVERPSFGRERDYVLPGTGASDGK